MATGQPKPYKRMAAFIAVAFVIACGLALWFSVKIHPGDPVSPAAATSAPAG